MQSFSFHILYFNSLIYYHEYYPSNQAYHFCREYLVKQKSEQFNYRKKTMQKESPFTGDSFFEFRLMLLGQIKCFHQEDGHLGTRDRCLRAVIPIPTTGRDALCHQLLDPGG